MPCFHPVQGYRSKTINPTGKRSIVFKPSDGFVDLPVTLPCGRCIGCRLERSKQWATRCVHESQLHTANCFITLTISPENLPASGSLDKKDFPAFMKRLRKSIEPNTVRFFHCGEYGEHLGRPHHHACIFGHDFPDKEPLFSGEYTLYSSKKLDTLWRLGHCTIGEFNFETAAYTARYILKKQLGMTDEALEAHYQGKLPEYCTQSNRPGIGANWIDKYATDVFPDDFCVIRKNKKVKPPKYYFQRCLEKAHLNMQQVQTKRREHQKLSNSENTPDRLATKEESAYLRSNQQRRNI